MEQGYRALEEWSYDGPGSATKLLNWHKTTNQALVVLYSGVLTKQGGDTRANPANRLRPVTPARWERIQNKLTRFDASTPEKGEPAAIQYVSCRTYGLELCSITEL